MRGSKSHTASGVRSKKKNKNLEIQKRFLTFVYCKNLN